MYYHLLPTDERPIIVHYCPITAKLLSVYTIRLPPYYRLLPYITIYYRLLPSDYRSITVLLLSITLYYNILLSITVDYHPFTVLWPRCYHPITVYHVVLACITLYYRLLPSDYRHIAAMSLSVYTIRLPPYYRILPSITVYYHLLPSDYRSITVLLPSITV